MRFSILLIIVALLTTNISNAAQNVSTNRSATASAVNTAVIGPQGRVMTLKNLDQLQVIAPDTPIMPENAAAERNKIAAKALQLNAQGTVRLSGAIRGLGMDIYHFSAQKGARIHIINQRADAMQFAIFRPGMGMRFGNEQILPQSGAYELRIINDRKNAAHNRKPYPYAVTFTVIRGGLSAASGTTRPQAKAATAARSVSSRSRSVPERRITIQAPKPVAKAQAVAPPPRRNVSNPSPSMPKHTIVKRPPTLAPQALAVNAPRRATGAPKAIRGYRQYHCDNGTINANISPRSASVRSGSLVLALPQRSGSGNSMVYSNGVYILTAAADGSNIYSLDLKRPNGTERLMSACR